MSRVIAAVLLTFPSVAMPEFHWTTASASGEVERVIVSCESERCDDTGGAFRIEVVLGDGSTTQEIGRGGYGDFEQP